MLPSLVGILDMLFCGKITAGIEAAVVDTILATVTLGELCMGTDLLTGASKSDTDTGAVDTALEREMSDTSLLSGTSNEPKPWKGGSLPLELNGATPERGTGEDGGEFSAAGSAEAGLHVSSRVQLSTPISTLLFRTAARS